MPQPATVRPHSTFKPGMHLRFALRTLRHPAATVFAFATLITVAGSACAQGPADPIGAPVPHRFLVTYRSGSAPTDASARVRLVGARLLRSAGQSGVAVVQSGPETNDDATMAALRAQPGVEAVVHDRIVSAHALRLRPVPATLGVIVSQQPYDSYYNSPQGWAVQQAGGYGAGVPGGPAHGPWDITKGAGVRIAILDTGVDPNHPDIAPNLAFNLSEVDQSAATGLPSPCDDGTSVDQQGHGTWTASLAAGAMGPGTGLVIGVAPQATLLNIKVLERVPDPSVPSGSVTTQCETGEGSGLLSWVIQGIEDATAQHADVISLSLGTLIDLESGEGAGLQAMFNQVTYAAAQAGAVIVASAGNDGLDLANPRYVELPAQARGVLAIVASTNPACAENLTAGGTCAPGPVTLPYYSNYGAPLNAIAAPGGSYPDGTTDMGVSGWVRGACSMGLANTTDGAPADSTHSLGCFNLGHTQYVQAIGTSASAPLAAGVAALIRAAHPAWTASQIVSAMLSAATPSTSLPAAPQLSAAPVTTP